jgi:nucleoside-diphosphate-sugar epimerase
MASPVSFSFTDPAYVINTSVNGTISILRSALKAGSQLRSVVYISSIAAVTQPYDPPYTYTEKDWNTWAPAEAERQGQTLPGPITYVASKAKAELEFWRFKEENEPSFAMTAVNPGYAVTSEVFLGQRANDYALIDS